MIDRREFLEAAMAAAVASQRADVLFAARQTGPIGANDRIRVGLIGCGNRGNQVATDWMKHKDSVFTAACDVARDRLEKTAARLGQTQNNTVETYEDYRRILDRKDVDAVLIATPDHWHGPMTVDACAAGKDVYVEKPVSNEIAPALKMVEAARKHTRVVQVGLQQRSWHHFQEAARLFQDNYIGTARQSLPDVSPRWRRRIRGATAAADAARTSARLQLGTVPGSREAQAVRAGPEKLARLVRLWRRQPHGLGRAPDGRHALVHEDGRHDAAADQRLGAIRAHPHAIPNACPIPTR